MDKVRVGILGFGTVGEGAYRMLMDNQAAIESKSGIGLEVVRIGVRDMDRERGAPRELFTRDLESIVRDPDIDIILELIGGLDPAESLIEAALSHGKHVVTANKELIAKQGHALMRRAASQGLDLHFEAAVGGGIPLIQPLKHQLAGNDVLKLMGIVNGTTNYILSKMTQEGRAFDEVLQEAQAAGYAEAEPSSDVDGFDAQYKLSILSSIAFGGEVRPEKIPTEGIRRIGARDIDFAKMLGYRIKLLAIAELLPEGILARVHPTMLPRQHPLANVHGVYNAVWVKGDFVGDVMLSGRGAGAFPTGSAVVGDIIDICRNIRIGGSASVQPPQEGLYVLSIDQLRTRYYMRLTVQDRPKVLGIIAGIFGEEEIGLRAMEMRELNDGLGEIVFLTHLCQEQNLQRAMARLAATEVVACVENWVRVEEESE
ncbi:MAG TPA: homoserine dehydrogenase [Fimbriimonadaceae bacterium]|nr:homoserine dehydrogenase [Fimbriimonadaceae bacterium]HRJ32083.1 homoserine dehydrogenase [Fimbriimonadaceae bacterium]